MKHQFVFDKKSGTMKTVGEPTEAVVDNSNAQEMAEIDKPVFQNEGRVLNDVESVQSYQEPIKMKRVSVPTPVHLVGDNNVLEAYLDSISSGVLMFRERKDYDIYQIVDERTNRPLMYIGGYALSISFNLDELKSVDKIEQCVQGLSKLFRKLIMEQALNRE